MKKIVLLILATASVLLAANPAIKYLSSQSSTSILSLSGMSYWVAGQETDSQNLTQLGSSGAGAAQFGSTSGSDSNDPTALSWSGTDYLWFPGTAGNTLSVARPVASVDVVITYDDDSTDSSLTAQTDDPLVFGGTDVLFADLNIKSIQLKNNSGGAEVGLFQAVNATQSGETDSYSNVWSIARSASGLKSTLVTRPVIMFSAASSTYLTVADHDDLDFGDGDFTIFFYGRFHDSNGSNNYLINKAGEGKWTAIRETGGNWQTLYNDGSGFVNAAVTPLFDSAAEVYAGTVDGTTLTTYADGTNTASVNGGDLSNTANLIIGSVSPGSAHIDCEFFGAGVLKGTALTATQLASLKTELDTLLGGRTGE